MRVGDRVKSCVELAGRPSGTVGRVTEVDPLFVAVRFEDGRMGYYRPQQLSRSEREDTRS
jgi:hypothetical protein